MSVSRVVLAGLVCASLSMQVARAQGADDASKDTKGRLLHASKCVMSFGFGSGCDKDAPAPKADRAGSKGADGAVVTKASTITGGDDQSAATKTRFFHASKCVVSLGLLSSCDKDQATDAAAARPGHHADAIAAAPDTSTKGRFFQAARCVGSLGLIGDCDKK